jgi:hypothetical protein
MRDFAAENRSNMPVEVRRVGFPSARALGELRGGAVREVSINETSDREGFSSGFFWRARVLAILGPPKGLSRRRSGLIGCPRRAVNANGVNVLSPANPAFLSAYTFRPLG